MPAVAEPLPNAPVERATRDTLIAIVGNPNSGKSTIFNALTGLKQKVANYPGVTVEKREGSCTSQHGKRLRLLDLPGAYSLNARSPDEAVVRDVLMGRRPDVPRPDAVGLPAGRHASPDEGLFPAGSTPTPAWGRAGRFPPHR